MPSQWTFFFGIRCVLQATAFAEFIINCFRTDFNYETKTLVQMECAYVRWMDFGLAKMNEFHSAANAISFAFSVCTFDWQRTNEKSCMITITCRKKKPIGHCNPKSPNEKDKKKIECPIANERRFHYSIGNSIDTGRSVTGAVSLRYCAQMMNI